MSSLSVEKYGWPSSLPFIKMLLEEEPFFWYCHLLLRQCLPENWKQMRDAEKLIIVQWWQIRGNICPASGLKVWRSNTSWSVWNMSPRLLSHQECPCLLCPASAVIPLFSTCHSHDFWTSLSRVCCSSFLASSLSSSLKLSAVPDCEPSCDARNARQEWEHTAQHKPVQTKVPK